MAANMNNQLWRKLADFVITLRKANRAQLEDAIVGLKQGSADYGLPSTDRAIYKKLLPILRKELREFSPKRNPTKKKAKKKKVTRKNTPRVRRNPKKPDYIIAGFDGKNVFFLHASNQWTQRKNAVRFTSKAFAKKIAQSAANAKGVTVGVVPENMLTTRIKAEFNKALKGKA